MRHGGEHVLLLRGRKISINGGSGKEGPPFQQLGGGPHAGPVLDEAYALGPQAGQIGSGPCGGCRRSWGGCGFGVALGVGLSPGKPLWRPRSAATVDALAIDTGNPGVTALGFDQD